MLKTTKFRAIFDEIFGGHIVCGDEIQGPGKPDPEIFGEALKTLLAAKREREVYWGRSADDDGS